MVLVQEDAVVTLMMELGIILQAAVAAVVRMM